MDRLELLRDLSDLFLLHQTLPYVFNSVTQDRNVKQWEKVSRLYPRVYNHVKTTHPNDPIVLESAEDIKEIEKGIPPYHVEMARARDLS